MSLKNKRILITSGPTWVSIDKVRVISNIATGETGILLAEEALRQGAKVTLFLGPVSVSYLPRPIRLVRFAFFKELKDRIKKELESGRYDLVIHSAAVSDFKPVKVARGKLGSGRRLSLELEPLPKIIDYIKKFAPRAKMVIFKLEAGLADATLISRALLARDKYKAEVIVANQLNPYRAFIIDKKDGIIKVKSKRELVKRLFQTLEKIG
jgi:phosphopantothenoylcysteine decarboxylase/phosphopantothenate--cysteine ligase